MDIVSHSLLGSSVDALGTPQAYQEEFSKAFDIIQRTHAVIQEYMSAHPGGSQGVFVLTTWAGGSITSSPRRGIRRV